MNEINFNQSPYYDDFDENSNYVKVLFKTNVSIQTRELNNVQSLFKNQIKRFGDHIFQNGAIINGARMNYADYDWVGIDDINFIDNTQNDFSFLENGAILQGRVTRLKAKCIFFVSKNEKTNYKNIVYLTYLNSAIDGETRTFLQGEMIDVIDNDGNVIYAGMKVCCPSCDDKTSTDTCIGKGTLFFLEEGYFYYNGDFIYTPSQTIVLTYLKTMKDSQSNLIVGLKLIKNIVTSDDDESLFDNSLGYPNKTSNGADRFQIKLELTSWNYDEIVDFEYIKLYSYYLGLEDFRKQENEYSRIDDELARRTYEERGNFAITPFNISFQDDKDNFLIKIPSSIHYVNGKRFENKNTLTFYAPKTNSTKTLKNFVTSFEEKQYILLKPYPGFSGYFGSANTNNVMDNSAIECYDGAINQNSKLPTGTKIGTFKIFDMKLENGTPNIDAIYRYYIYDLNMIEGKTLNDAKSFFHATNNFLAEPTTNFAFNNSANNNLLFLLNKNYIKTLNDENENGTLIYTKRKKYTGKLDSLGQISFNDEDNEMFLDFDNSTIVSLISNGIVSNFNTNNINYTITANGINLDFGKSNAGKNIVLITNVLTTNVKEKTKTLKQNVDVVRINSIDDSIILSKSDIHQIDQITLMNMNSSDKKEMDVEISAFSLFNGQTDYYYTNGTLKIVDKSKLISDFINNIQSYSLKITYSYFEHSSDDGYFSIDSYKSLINDNIFDYATLPIYTTQNGSSFDLKNTLDFRPLVLNNEISNIAIPSLQSIAYIDVTYYQPRIDLLEVTPSGYKLKIGISDDNPIPPSIDDDAMPLFYISVPPYVTNISLLKKTPLWTKGYTMKAIGGLDERLRNSEYYVALNLLEKSAADMQITNANGLDRFKNGFMVDDFGHFQAADLNNPEFKCSNDLTNLMLRPTYNVKNKKLKLDVGNSSNYVINDNVITAPIIGETVISKSSYATRSLSLNPYLAMTKIGNIILNPSFDNWVDLTQAPSLNFDVDFGTDAVNALAQQVNKMWGVWDGVFGTQQKNTTVNATTSTQKESIDLGSRLTSVSIVPYMRTKTIQFVAKDMAPNTKVYPFFDDKPVWKNCRMINSFWGSDLITDNNGQLIGEFQIPANTFFVGEKQFKLTSDPNNGNDPDAIITSATATYYAAGLNETAQNVTFNVTKPNMNVTLTVHNPPPPPPPVTTNNNGGGGARRDPLAQTFKLENDCLITALNLYFAIVDVNSEKIFVEIRTVENGYPTSIVLARKEYYPYEIITSNDASKPFKVKFDSPVYVKGNTDYAFVVGSGTPAHRIWVGHFGEKLINDTSKIMDNYETSGVSFRSQDGTTWTPDQFEDIKYELFCAKIDNSKPINLSFVVDIDDYIDIFGTNILESKTGSSFIRVHAENHGCSVNDKIQLFLFDTSPLNVSILDNLNFSKLNIGSTIYVEKTSNSYDGIATIKDISISNNTAKLILSNIQGDFSINKEIYDEHGNKIAKISSTFDQLTNIPLNGIPIKYLNKMQTVVHVDSKNSFVIDCGFQANASGFFGGIVKIRMNLPYDLFKLYGSRILYGGSETWKIKGIAHDHYMSNKLMYANYNQTDWMNIDFDKNIVLDQTYKLVIPENNSLVQNGDGRTFIQAQFTSLNQYISPMISLDTLSFTLVSNHVGWETEEFVNQFEPKNKNYFVDETDNASGIESYKYVSKPAYLLNPCADLYILLDVMCDNLADFDIYYRVIKNNDSISIYDMNWILIPLNKTKQNEFIEHSAILSEVFGSDWSNEPINTFQIKIVGKSINAAKPPYFKNLRVIALT